MVEGITEGSIFQNTHFNTSNTRTGDVEMEFTLSNEAPSTKSLFICGSWEETNYRLSSWLGHAAVHIKLQPESTLWLNTKICFPSFMTAAQKHAVASIKFRPEYFTPSSHRFCYLKWKPKGEIFDISRQREYPFYYTRVFFVAPVN